MKILNPWCIILCVVVKWSPGWKGATLPYLEHFILFFVTNSFFYNICSSSDDGTCRIWDARSSQCKPRIYQPKPSDALTGQFIDFTFFFNCFSVTLVDSHQLLYLPQGRATLLQIMDHLQAMVHKAIKYFVVLTMQMELSLSLVAPTRLLGYV